MIRDDDDFLVSVKKVSIWSGPNVCYLLGVGCCSNASDALDKVRFLSDMDPSQVEPDINLEIRIKPDLESGTITISYASSILNTPFVVTW
jgi:hypothetical protein